MSGFLRGRVIGVIGLAIGLVLGLAYTWVIDPVELVNTYPALLRTDYRHGWVHLVALSYVADGDLERARARLNGLEQEDMAIVIQALIEEYAAGGRPADTLRRLAVLAEAMNVHTPAMWVYLSPPASSPPSSAVASRPTSTPAAIHTPTPSASPTPTIPIPEPTPTATPIPTPTPQDVLPSIPFASEPTSTPPPPTATPPLLARLRLTSQEQICEPGQRPHIEVVVTDERGAGVSGVVVWLMWSGGADRAVTGLKPQKGTGYADFNAEPGANYDLGIGELGMPLVTDLQVEPCPLDEVEERSMGSWRIILGPQTPESESEGDNGR